MAVKFAYLFPFGNRLRGRVLSKLVGKNKFCRGLSCFHFRGALGPPDGGGAITAGVQGTQSHAAASAAPIYCFHLLAFIFASHISCQQHPRPGRPGHKTGSHWPLPPRRLEINIEGWRGGLEARRGGPGQGRDLKNCLQNCLQNCFVNAGGVGVGVETFLLNIGISVCLLSLSRNISNPTPTPSPKSKQKSKQKCKQLAQQIATSLWAGRLPGGSKQPRCFLVVKNSFHHKNWEFWHRP